MFEVDVIIEEDSYIYLINSNMRTHTHTHTHAIIMYREEPNPTNRSPFVSSSRYMNNPKPRG